MAHKDREESEASCAAEETSEEEPAEDDPTVPVLKARSPEGDETKQKKDHKERERGGKDKGHHKEKERASKKEKGDRKEKERGRADKERRADGEVRRQKEHRAREKERRGKDDRGKEGDRAPRPTGSDRGAHRERKARPRDESTAHSRGPRGDGSARPVTPPRTPQASGKTKCGICGQTATAHGSGQEQHRRSNLLCLSWQYWGRLDKESRKDPHAWQHCQERAGRAQRKYMGWDSEEEVVVEDEHSA